MSRSVGRCFARLFALLFSTLALTLSCFSSFWCESVGFPPDLLTSNENSATLTIQGSNSPHPTLRFGLFSYLKVDQTTQDSKSNGLLLPTYNTIVRDTCQRYDWDVMDVDPPWRIARFFAILVTVLGLLGTFMVWVRPSYTGSANALMTLNFLILLPIFQGLTLLVVQSSLCTDNPLVELNIGDEAGTYDAECKLDMGSHINLISICLWFLTGLCMVYLGVPHKTEQKRRAKRRNSSVFQADDEADMDNTANQSVPEVSAKAINPPKKKAPEEIEKKIHLPV